MSSHHPSTMGEGQTLEAIRQAIEAALPGAKVGVQGGGGHFSIEVVAPDLAGKTQLQRHRKVLGAIAHLMSGDAAPVHAVDTLIARAPGE